MILEAVSLRFFVADFGEKMFDFFLKKREVLVFPLVFDGQNKDLCACLYTKNLKMWLRLWYNKITLM